eukprot:scaffold2010_cov301-Prasinococcus_capsulatus_cf.AAC.13
MVTAKLAAESSSTPSLSSSCGDATLAAPPLRAPDVLRRRPATAPRANCCCCCARRVARRGRGRRGRWMT